MVDCCAAGGHSSWVQSYGTGNTDAISTAYSSFCPLSPFISTISSIAELQESFGSVTTSLLRVGLFTAY